MNEKPRLNSFSISNILGTSFTKDSKEKDAAKSENDQDKDIIEVDDNGEQNPYTTDSKTSPREELVYDWETESTDHDKSLTEFDRKYLNIFLPCLYFCTNNTTLTLARI